MARQMPFPRVPPKPASARQMRHLKPFCTSESIPNNILLKMYGGKMDINGVNGNDQCRWTTRNGDYNMPHMHADLVGDFRACGQLSMSNLVPGRTYKGVFELELTKDAWGWQHGYFEVTLTVPGSGSVIQPLKYDYNSIGTTFHPASENFQLARRPAPQRATNLSFVPRSGLIIIKGLMMKITLGQLLRRGTQLQNYSYNNIGTTFELATGNFKLATLPAAPSRDTNLISFCLSHTGRGTRSGLIIKRFVIRKA